MIISSTASNQISIWKKILNKPGSAYIESGVFMNCRIEGLSVLLTVGLLVLPVSIGLLSVSSSGNGSIGWNIQEQARVKTTGPRDLGIGEINGTVELTWHPPKNKENKTRGYRIYRSLDPEYRSLLTTTQEDTFLDEEVEKGRKYHYWVTAVFDDSEESSFSEEVHIQLDGYNVPTMPRDLDVQPGDSKVRLEWDEPSDMGNNQISNYIIHKKNSTGAVKNKSIGIVSHFTDGNVRDGTEYTYNVTAKNPRGESRPTKDKTAIPSASVGIPSAPKDLMAYQGKDQVELTWHPPDDNGGTPIYEYRIYREDEKIGTVGPGRTFYRDTGLEKEEDYIYSVSAVNVVGVSKRSAEQTAGLLGEEDIPSSPNNLRVEASAENRGRTLIWDEPNSTTPNILNYNIYRSTDGENFTLLAQTSPKDLTYQDKNVETDRVYFYKIKGVSTKNYLGEFSKSAYGSPSIQEKEKTDGFSYLPKLVITGVVSLASIGFVIALWVKWKNPRGPISQVKEWRLNEQEESEENKEETEPKNDQGSKN